MAKTTKRQREIIRRTLENAVVAVRDIPELALREFIPQLEAARNALLTELKAFEKTVDGAKKYTAHVRRSTLYQIEGALEEIRALGPSMAGLLTEGSSVAAIAAMDAMEGQLAALDTIFSGASVPISIDRAAVLAKGDKLLLKRYPSSARRYAGDIERGVKAGLSQGVLKQQSFFEIKQDMFKAMDNVFDGANWKASRLVRSEMMESYNLHHHESLIDAHGEDDDIKMRWDASFDFRRCPICADLDRRIVEVDGKFDASWSTAGGKARSATFQRPPAHPQCFVPGTKVRGDFVAGLKSNYSGEMIEILVQSGRRLTVTKNHPILTSVGFTNAGELTKDHCLLCYGSDIDGTPSLQGINVEDPPTEIEKVFCLFRDSGPSFLSPASAGDLNGDAASVDGNVETVLSYGPLKGGSERNRIGDFLAPVADASLSLIPSDGDLLEGGAALNGAPRCVMRRFDLSASLPSGHAGPLHPLRVGLTSEFNTGPLKPPGDDPTIHAEFLRELIDGSSGEVFFDRIVEVRKFDYSGHVYDLQSVSGWLVADGIIASNCRCVLVPWIDEWPSGADWPDNPPKDPNVKEGTEQT